jgi:DNA-binding transcriptional LysR family regulator
LRCSSARGRLTPTNEALALFPHIEKLFEQLDEVQRLAANLRHGQSADRLNVLTVFALSREVLPRAVAGFRRRHPQVQVHVQALHTPQVVSALLLQEADVGFVISSAGQPALEHELLAEVDMFCVCPRDCCRLRACAPKAWNSRIWPICLWSRSMRATRWACAWARPAASMAWGCRPW